MEIQGGATPVAEIYHVHLSGFGKYAVRLFGRQVRYRFHLVERDVLAEKIPGVARQLPEPVVPAEVLEGEVPVIGIKAQVPVETGTAGHHHAPHFVLTDGVDVALVGPHPYVPPATLIEGNDPLPPIGCRSFPPFPGKSVGEKPPAVLGAVAKWVVDLIGHAPEGRVPEERAIKHIVVAFAGRRMHDNRVVVRIVCREVVHKVYPLRIGVAAGVRRPVFLSNIPLDRIQVPESSDQFAIEHFSRRAQFAIVEKLPGIDLLEHQVRHEAFAVHVLKHNVPLRELGYIEIEELRVPGPRVGVLAVALGVHHDNEHGVYPGARQVIDGPDDAFAFIRLPGRVARIPVGHVRRVGLDGGPVLERGCIVKVGVPEKILGASRARLDEPFAVVEAQIMLAHVPEDSFPPEVNSRFVRLTHCERATESVEGIRTSRIRVIADGHSAAFSKRNRVVPSTRSIRREAGTPLRSACRRGVARIPIGRKEAGDRIGRTAIREGDNKAIVQEGIWTGLLVGERPVQCQCDGVPPFKFTGNIDGARLSPGRCSKYQGKGGIQRNMQRELH